MAWAAVSILYLSVLPTTLFDSVEHFSSTLFLLLYHESMGLRIHKMYVI